MRLLRMLRYASHVFTFLLHGVSTATIRRFSTRRINNNITFNTYLTSPNLNEQQQDILKAVAKKKSIFITGSAGTGKSFAICRAIELLKQIYRPSEVFITASTGVAACALNGQTLHSFAGIGLGVGDKKSLLGTVYRNKLACKRWQNAKALVIDEVSMISCDLFENLEYIARKMRPSVNKPWGGIQLIVSGDFFQLPPIIRGGSDKEFAFEAECWDGSFDLQVELTQMFRQSDTDLIDLLQGIRRGRQDEHHLQILNHCCVEPVESSSTVPWLYPRNVDVKRVNDEMIRNLGKEIFKYKAMDSGKQPWKRQLTQGIAPDELEICVGARVMLIKNKDLDNGLVNGATGTVLGFVKSTSKKSWGILLPKVKFDSGALCVIEPETWEAMEGELTRATRKQIPLILAWAVSVHKCQGMTLDCLYTDLSRAFGYGMVYVALSRVRSLKGLYLSGFCSSKIKAHPKVLKYYESQLDG